MGILELLLVAVGLSMDAFAVAVCKGLNMSKINYKRGALIALFFGTFQGLMPLIGWFLGVQFEKYIVSFDHWVAFALLGFIGGKMIAEAFEKEKEDCCPDKFSIGELFILAIATSIDALAVGITFALIAPTTGISVAVILIGVITFALSFVGVVIGNKFGAKYKKRAELAGGIILCLMGLKILLEHLEIINF
ncbi:MAG: manganese efflux pump [Ruminococcaceae bacterium]|nr:manganese efflux pump [Oscillospiraceae bacterium]